MFLNIFRPSKSRQAAQQLYFSVVTASRQEEFYTKGGVEDNLDGRFDMMALVAALLIERIRREGPTSKKMVQSLFDVFIDESDSAIREAGFGDIGVGYRIKKMVAAFRGRMVVYGKALKSDNPDIGALEEALRRNLFRAKEIGADQLATMIGYCQQVMAALEAQDYGQITDGTVQFPKFSAAVGASANDV